MRLWLVPFLVALAAACSSSGPPHSAYYVVPFQRDAAAVGTQGRVVIAQALEDIKGDQPAAIVLKCYVGPEQEGKDLSEARLRAVDEALVGGGVAANLIRSAAATTDAATYERLGNGVVVQIERGDLMPPKSATDE
jgi:hypothetical protein